MAMGEGFDLPPNVIVLGGIGWDSGNWPSICFVSKSLETVFTSEGVVSTGLVLERVVTEEFGVTATVFDLVPIWDVTSDWEAGVFVVSEDAGSEESGGFGSEIGEEDVDDGGPDCPDPELSILSEDSSKKEAVILSDPLLSELISSDEME